MLKWVFIFLLLGIGLSVYWQHQIQPTSATDKKQTPTVSVRTPGPGPIREHGPITGSSAQKGKLSRSEERLMNRVPPVHERQLKDEVLPQ